MPALQKSSNKRPAPSQGGPKSKKPHIAKPPASKAKSDGPDGNKKRSRPVTLPMKEDSDSEDDEEDSDDLEDVVDAEESQKVDGGDEMIVDSIQPKDPNAARESHKAQRLLQDQRRAAKPHSQLLTDAKRVWSQARQKNIPTTERQKHVRELMGVVRGKVKDIVLKHDASRIIQTIVKYGGQKERDEVAGELKGHYKDLAQNKYSKFLVTKLIRLCPTHRASILMEFQSHVMRLLLHREASSVLADTFELYANAYERTILLRDFYGKETSLFTTTRGTEEEKEVAKKGLRGVLQGVEGERRKRVLTALKGNLTTIFNNPDKGAITHAITHRALWEYLSAVNDVEAEREPLRKEIFENCQDVLAEMVHTKDGSRVVRDFLAYGTAKDRKHIIKVIKPHVERMCVDDEAQLVLFTALDAIDDTKLTAKSLVADIVSHASTLATTPQGRRSLFYLIVPRTRRHFTPAQIVTVAETDSIREKTSKKDNAVREGEVRKAASEGLLKFVEESGAEVARDTGGSLVVLEIMLYADGDKNDAISALLAPLSLPYPSDDSSKPHPIDLPHTSRMYKSLLQGGHFSHVTKSISQSPAFSSSGFASAFLKHVGKEATIAMAEGDGAFVVAELLQRIREEGSEQEKVTIKQWFGKSVVARIKDGEVKGKNVLLEKIAAFS
ncbi:ARM repeat-containing protein [Leucogyrophana mollusca]|uniref:ARM repeat-containing protein n=1 Tax=Leucogyrophana mollusca TaxID=85980 RepID=A0ACB8BB57_9AGAM|nr:ARM repeat-containing protein [Leucogyrophana mollusca]